MNVGMIKLLAFCLLNIISRKVRNFDCFLMKVFLLIFPDFVIRLIHIISLIALHLISMIYVHKK